MSDKKQCFVIAPIGKDDSDIRKRSDQTLRHIIVPAATMCGYAEPIRADQISKPGIITAQIIERLVDDPLVIADLTNHNPNVFYELAIRHAVRKPVIQIIAANETIPFDVGAVRTILVDLQDPDSVASARATMIEQIHAVEESPEEVVNSPLSAAIDFKAFRTSETPDARGNAKMIIEAIQDVRSMLADFRDNRKMIQEIRHHLERYHYSNYRMTQEIRHMLKDALSKPLSLEYYTTDKEADTILRQDFQKLRKHIEREIHNSPSSFTQDRTDTTSPAPNGEPPEE